MGTVREDHRATLLPNGEVLIVGGTDGTNVVASAEIFNPAGNSGAGSFSGTGSLGTARRLHSATPLANGKVLVVGGIGTGPITNVLNSAELFDPTANAGVGAFSPVTATLVLARNSHTATLLHTGHVLIAGGYDGTTTVGITEFFDPQANSGAGDFFRTGSLSTARRFHTATLLANGNVLIADGMNAAGAPLNTAELYTVTLCGPLIQTPQITNLNPASGGVGTSVTISGSNFGAAQGSSNVFFNGTTAPSATSWGHTQIVVAVPSGTTTAE